MAVTAIIDSSSAILLFKTGLFNNLLEIYCLAMAESVFQELTCPNHPGSPEFSRYREENKFTVLEASPGEPFIGPHPNLGKGELDTIALFLNKSGDFIIMDDGKGVNLCMARTIPYINALLIPRILFFSGKITEKMMIDKTGSIIAIGRYSRAIINYALSCTRDDLNKFLG